MRGEPVRGRTPDPGFYSLSGLEQSRAWLKGLAVRGPGTYLTGMVLTQVGAGNASGSMPASPWLQTFDGTVECRLLMEAVLGFAVLTGAPPAHGVHPSTLTMNSLRPSTLQSDVIVARARTLNSGPRFTLAEVLVEDGMGRAVAHGTGTYLVRPIEPAPPPYEGTGSPIALPVYATPDPYLRPLAWSPRDIPEEMTFLEVARAFITGDVPPPPVHQLLGIRVVDVGEGSCVLAMDASPWLCLRTADVMPGAIASFAHHLLGGAAATLVPLRHRMGILDQTVTFLHGVPADGRELLARATVTNRRDNFLVVHAELTDADGSVVAVGHQTALVSPPRERSPATGPDRVLATVLFTDIVDFTCRAEELGDSRWRELLEEHHAAVRRQLGLWKGREVKTTGDGFLATFVARTGRAMRPRGPRWPPPTRIGGTGRAPYGRVRGLRGRRGGHRRAPGIEDAGDGRARRDPPNRNSARSRGRIGAALRRSGPSCPQGHRRPVAALRPRR